MHSPPPPPPHHHAVHRQTQFILQGDHLQLNEQKQRRTQRMLCNSYQLRNGWLGQTGIRVGGKGGSVYSLGRRELAYAEVLSVIR